MERDKNGKFLPGHNIGRPQGSSNRNNRDIKQAFRDLIEGNLDNLQTWLSQTAEQNPKYALDAVLKLSEFILPKSRNIQINSLNELTDEELDALLDRLIQKQKGNE